MGGHLNSCCSFQRKKVTNLRFKVPAVDPLGVGVGGVAEFRAGSAREHCEVLLKFVFSCADVTQADIEPTRLW